ncbi:hypothetical protein SSP531S_39510 [Streptomyces spongiicola]|uniref:Chlorophyllase n=1 Tax=Streptomyces spongiicola TaxID=1690221 RepID=A0A388T2U4_9ACTN|nr:DUF2255 family protein [Streptomyces spongiicola]GBQ02492.1 hypothetical protein SSP531S_39510 [Streptomyces spongiicola]
MTDHIAIPARAGDDLSGPLVSVAPVAFPSRDRPAELQVRLTAPMTDRAPPIVVLSHGHGPSQYVSSLYGYAPLANHLAASGFAVLQPTHLDSATLGLRHADSPEAPLYRRSRAGDVSSVLDHLGVLQEVVPDVAARMDTGRIAVVGHSMGGHTASMVLGALPRDPATGHRVNARDRRVGAGVVMAAPGRGGDALNPRAARHHPVLNDTDFTTMAPPTLVVAGDQDHAHHLNVVGAAWQTDAFHLSPGPKFLLDVHGGEHSLGGISGYDSAETTDGSLTRALLFLETTAAFLRTRLGVDDRAWSVATARLAREHAASATVHEKRKDVPRWTDAQLRRVQQGDDFHVAPDRDADRTPGRFVWVWAVALGGDVYARSATRNSRWFHSAVTYGRGAVAVADGEPRVEFSRVDDEAAKDRADEAFRAKYSKDPYFSEDLLKNSRHQIARIRPLGP